MKQKEIDNIHDKIRNPLTIIQLELISLKNHQPDIAMMIGRQVERINEFLKSLKENTTYSLLRIEKTNIISVLFTTTDREMFKNCKLFCSSLDNLFVENSESEEITSLTEFLNTTSNT